MAKKAAKQTAKRNEEKLRQTHIVSLVVNAFFLSMRVLIFRSSLSTTSIMKYLFLAAPGFVIQFVFESSSRPSYQPDGELRSGGNDLDAVGLTEWMFDVLYWTWGCTILAALVGDAAWWAYIAVPLYSVYAAYTAYGNVRKSLTGMTGGAADGQGSADGMSNRQRKREQKGDQAKVRYR